MEESALNNLGGREDIYYLEPDLSGAVEGVDYTIQYGVNGEEEESE